MIGLELSLSFCTISLTIESTNCFLILSVNSTVFAFFICILIIVAQWGLMTLFSLMLVPCLRIHNLSFNLYAVLDRLLVQVVHVKFGRVVVVSVRTLLFVFKLVELSEIASCLSKGLIIVWLTLKMGEFNQISSFRFLCRLVVAARRDDSRVVEASELVDLLRVASHLTFTILAALIFWSVRSCSVWFT